MERNSEIQLKVYVVVYKYICNSVVNMVMGLVLGQSLLVIIIIMQKCLSFIMY